MIKVSNTSQAFTRLFPRNTPTREEDWFSRHPLPSLPPNRFWAILTLERADSGIQYPPASRSDVPYINQMPWSSTMSPSTVGTYSRMQPTPTVPSSPYALPSSAQSNAWPNQAWSALHPDGFQGTRSRATSGSDISRSSSPNPAELHNFGYPLADGYALPGPRFLAASLADLGYPTGEVGDALIRDAPLKLFLLEVATCANTFVVTLNHSSAVMKIVRNQPREASLAKKIVTDTRQSTDQACLASGKGVKGSSAVWIT